MLVPACLSTSALASLRTTRLKHSGCRLADVTNSVSFSILRLISIRYGVSLLIQIELHVKIHKNG